MTFESKVPPFVRLLFPSGNAFECVQSVPFRLMPAGIASLFPGKLMNAKSGYSRLAALRMVLAVRLCNLRSSNDTHAAYLCQNLFTSMTTNKPTHHSVLCAGLQVASKETLLHVHKYSDKFLVF